MDGGCLTKDKIGGWAYVIVDNDRKVYAESGCKVPTTNNIMELYATYKAFKWLLEYTKEDKPEIVYFYSDSAYVVNGLNIWVHKWKIDNWKKYNGRAVKNKEIWEKLHNLHMKLINTGVKIVLKRVKGHSGIYYNEMVDNMCTMEIEGLVNNIEGGV